MDRLPTYGEKAVGLSFNPSALPEVDAAKRAFADEIDRLDALRKANPASEVARLASAAITHIQTAQMWAVKALTYKD